MIRVAEVVKGMRVVTPMGRIARVEGVSLQTSDLFQRVHLRYHDTQDETVALQAKLLRPYTGDSIMFRDETEGLRMKHGDVPLPPPLTRLPGSE
jgi:UDP-N-acetylmuramyl tripeptide synthase